MRTDELTTTLETLFSELMHGVSRAGGFMLNVGDHGLLRSLERVSAAEASVLTRTGSSIAAHVDHLRYGLSLMNRWAAGEDNPFGDADWEASWRRKTVTEEQWRELRDKLRRQAAQWQKAVAARTQWDDMAAAGTIASVAHTAYHLGAIRQILAGMS